MSEPISEPTPAAATDTVERHTYGAEVGRLLDLVIHSLYSEREIFLRELVANAADATDRRRFEALTNPALTIPGAARVRIVPDKGRRTLTIADDGIGMDRAAMIENLGTIARSGTRAFGQALAAADGADRPALIGQFGVGFYAAFMVADRVEVTSRAAGTDAAHVWSSTGADGFELSPAERAEAGTDVVLHLKEDADEYLEPHRLEAVVRKWSDNVTLPVVIVRDGAEVAANEGTALWRKPRAEVSDEDAEGFFRGLGNLWGKPWARIQWRAEGAVDFYALLFIPDEKPFEMGDPARTSKLRLHVRRMFITDDAGLLPPWLRFVQGVVDTDDLPLNVSREMLQATPVLTRLRRAVTNRVVSELKARAKGDDYVAFWEKFGSILKEGAYDDAEHRGEIAALLRFRSSAVDGFTSLAEYVARMPEGQAEILYLVGDDAQALKSSPQLEGERARGREVLLLDEAIDGFWPERVQRFDGRSLKSLTQLAPEPLKTAVPEPVAVLLAEMKAALGARVSDVRATERLTDSAVVLASAAGAGPDLAVQRLLRRSGREGFPAAAPVLEVNPSHTLILSLARRDRAEIGRVAAVLLDLAHVQDGDAPPDPAAFVRAVTAMIAPG